VLTVWLSGLFITVSFNGTPVHCLVDTGATHTVVAQEAAAAIGGLSQPLQAIRLSAANGTPMNGAVYRVPDVRTAHLSWPEGSVVVVPGDVLDKSTPCVLGINLLGQQPIFIDWQAGEVRPVPRDLIAVAAPTGPNSAGAAGGQ
jgi:predicted aspartyl protease